MITEKEIDAALTELMNELTMDGVTALPLKRGVDQFKEVLVIEKNEANRTKALIEEIGLPLIVQPIRGTGLAEIKPCIF